MIAEESNSYRIGEIFVSDKNNRNILIGILVCLIIIALKPVSSFDSDFDSDFLDSFDVYNDKGKTVVQLAENRIAIVDTNENSAYQGKVLVLEFDGRKETFDAIGRYDYFEALYEEEW